MFIERMTSMPRDVLTIKQGFYGTPVEIDEELAKRILQVQDDATVVSDYLTAAKAGTLTVEIPQCLNVKVTPVAAKGSPRKKKASVASSRKKSPTVSKKTAARTTTSQSQEK